MAQFGFIGMGNMGYAMLNGVLGEFAPGQIIFTTPHKEKCEKISAQTGVKYAESNAECANNAKYIILAVKPQMKLGGSVRVVRAMPNTPALVGEGMTGISYNKEEFTIEERNTIEQFFQSFGEVVTVPEHLMSAVVCASGSSPAYAYMFIEALADSVVKYGIPRQDAYKLAAQTLLGSAKMVLQTGEHPGKLKDNVCSPAGTTIQGVAALEEYGFRNAVIKATDKCYEACTKIK